MYEDSIRSTTSALVASGLGKRFGELWALRDLDLEVAPGSVLGLLGHNGAGKTTAIRILTTLSQPTTGRASVAGYDVVADAAQVRAHIGVAGQSATVDGLLTARANLEMLGRLHGRSRTGARARADELLERLRLAAEADRLVRTLSGGMRRRVDLAASLVSAAPVLFLDEPTTGLDPQSRSELWALLRELVGEGTALLLTTQYLEEADRLADEIVLLDHGATIASGSPSELKARIGGDRLVVTLADAAELDAAMVALAGYVDAPPTVEHDGAPYIVAPVRPEVRPIEVLRALDAAGLNASDVHRRAATLDDVFLTLTSPGAVPTP